MSEEAKRLLAQVMTLPVEERANIATELLASLDGLPSENTEEAWAAEIERRARRLLSGEDPGEPWQAVRSELWSEFGPK